MKLYTRISNEFAKCGNKWAENLRKKFSQTEENLAHVSEDMKDLGRFANSHYDLMEDCRGDMFSTEDFVKSHVISNLEYDTEEILGLLTALNRRIKHAQALMKDFEIEYSEDLDKLYTEEHKYDYERA